MRETQCVHAIAFHESSWCFWIFAFLEFLYMMFMWIFLSLNCQFQKITHTTAMYPACWRLSIRSLSCRSPKIPSIIDTFMLWFLTENSKANYSKAEHPSIDMLALSRKVWILDTMGCPSTVICIWFVMQNFEAKNNRAPKHKSSSNQTDKFDAEEKRCLKCLACAVGVFPDALVGSWQWGQRWRRYYETMGQQRNCEPELFQRQTCIHNHLVINLMGSVWERLRQQEKSLLDFPLRCVWMIDLQHLQWNCLWNNQTFWPAPAINLVAVCESSWKSDRHFLWCRIDESYESSLNVVSFQNTMRQSRFCKLSPCGQIRFLRSASRYCSWNHLLNDGT